MVLHVSVSHNRPSAWGVGRDKHAQHDSCFFPPTLNVKCKQDSTILQNLRNESLAHAKQAGHFGSFTTLLYFVLYLKK